MSSRKAALIVVLVVVLVVVAACETRPRCYVREFRGGGMVTQCR